MNRNQQKPAWRVVDAGAPLLTYGKPDPVLLPQTATIALDDYDPPLLLEFAWSRPKWAMVLVGIRGAADQQGHPQGLPARLTRQLAPRQLIADVLRRLARRAHDKTPGSVSRDELLAWGVDYDGAPGPSPQPSETPGYEVDGEYFPSWRESAELEGLSTWEQYQRLAEGLPPISKGTAEALARPRDKSQQSVVMMRQRAAAVAAQLTDQGLSGRELYDAVAAELGVGSTTAYTYLRAAGVIKKAAWRR